MRTQYVKKNEEIGRTIKTWNVMEATLVYRIETINKKLLKMPVRK